MIHDIQLGIAKTQESQKFEGFFVSFLIGFVTLDFLFPEKNLKKQVACEAADKKPRRKGKWRQAKVGPVRNVEKLRSFLPFQRLLFT